MTTPAYDRSYRRFFTELLEHLTLPVSVEALRALAIVNRFENPDGKLVWNNPLAEEQPWTRDAWFNSAGVRVYATFWDGVDATAERLRLPAWAGVRQAIADIPGSSYSRDHVLDAFTAIYHPWSSVNFRTLAYNTPAVADRRLAMLVLGPDYRVGGDA